VGAHQKRPKAREGCKCGESKVMGALDVCLIGRLEGYRKERVLKNETGANHYDESKMCRGFKHTDRGSHAGKKKEKKSGPT